MPPQDGSIHQVRRHNEDVVTPIIDDVRTRGDAAVKEYTWKFEKVVEIVQTPERIVENMKPAHIAGCKTIVLATPPSQDGTIFKEGSTVLCKESWSNSYPQRWRSSEVLVIADKHAIPRHVAPDLLSQAEHGPDSQVVLVIAGEGVNVNAIEEELNKQFQSLPRGDFSAKAHSFIVYARDVLESINFSNLYAPEHLIVSVEDAEKSEGFIENAGSVFLGSWSPNRVGDYEAEQTMCFLLMDMQGCTVVFHWILSSSTLRLHIFLGYKTIVLATPAYQDGTICKLCWGDISRRSEDTWWVVQTTQSQSAKILNVVLKFHGMLMLHARTVVKESPKERYELLWHCFRLKARPRVGFSSVFAVVNPIVDDVSTRGDATATKYTWKFEKAKLGKAVEFEAFDVAYNNIYAFHAAQKTPQRLVEKMKGVQCKRVARSISSVGLYVPGGTAVLPSTALMLSVVLYCAKKAGVTCNLKAGGVQAIAAMAWGTETRPKKIRRYMEGGATTAQSQSAKILNVVLKFHGIFMLHARTVVIESSKERSVYLSAVLALNDAKCFMES
ncbi:hypothetical protein PIB30_058083 [Stylosanthes scabra]|uniref:Histidinol dehydrogenase n=1 Tax=Stylosanthes scabra TaxID=79078 RepID=A0ABU6TJM4_9FABA|nr:hypothetical protein [Stylosanthes scabra]